MNTFLLIELYWHGFKARGTGWQNEINGASGLGTGAADAERPTMKAHTAPCDGFSKNDPGKRAWFLSFKRYSPKSHSPHR
jgi:hypothetical protein